MIEDKILEGLQKAVITAVGSKMAVKPIGRTFEPPADKPWLELVHIPNNVTGEFWGKEKTYRGLFRLLFRFPLLDVGAYPHLRTISDICTLLPKGSIFTAGGVSIKLYEGPDLMGAMEDPPHMLYPVQLQYISFQP